MDTTLAINIPIAVYAYDRHKLATDPKAVKRIGFYDKRKVLTETKFQKYYVKATAIATLNLIKAMDAETVKLLVDEYKKDQTGWLKYFANLLNKQPDKDKVSNDEKRDIALKNEIIRLSEAATSSANDQLYKYHVFVPVKYYKINAIYAPTTVDGLLARNVNNKKWYIYNGRINPNINLFYDTDSTVYFRELKQLEDLFGVSFDNQSTEEEIQNGILKSIITKTTKSFWTGWCDGEFNLNEPIDLISYVLGNSTILIVLYTLCSNIENLEAYQSLILDGLNIVQLLRNTFNAVYIYFQRLLLGEAGAGASMDAMEPSEYGYSPVPAARIVSTIIQQSWNGVQAVIDAPKEIPKTAAKLLKDPTTKAKVYERIEALFEQGSQTLEICYEKIRLFLHEYVTLGIAGGATNAIGTGATNAIGTGATSALGSITNILSFFTIPNIRKYVRLGVLFFNLFVFRGSYLSNLYHTCACIVSQTIRATLVAPFGGTYSKRWKNKLNIANFKQYEMSNEMLETLGTTLSNLEDRTVTIEAERYPRGVLEPIPPSELKLTYTETTRDPVASSLLTFTSKMVFVYASAVDGMKKEYWYVYSYDKTYTIAPQFIFRLYEIPKQIMKNRLKKNVLSKPIPYRADGAYCKQTLSNGEVVGGIPYVTWVISSILSRLLLVASKQLIEQGIRGDLPDDVKEGLEGLSGADRKKYTKRYYDNYGKNRDLTKIVDWIYFILDWYLKLSNGIYSRVIGYGNAAVVGLGVFESYSYIGPTVVLFGLNWLYKEKDRPMPFSMDPGQALTCFFARLIHNFLVQLSIPGANNIQ